MSTHVLSDGVQIKQEIKQDIEDQELNVDNTTDTKCEIDIEEHPLFHSKTEPIVFESVCPSIIKSEQEQDLDVDVSTEISTVDPLAVDPWENAESCKHSENSEKQIDPKNKLVDESVIDTKSPPSLTLKKCFECNVCKKPFSRNSRLVRHLRIHTGEKPYECTVCKKKFVQSTQLTVHSRTHTGEKPYECTVCKKTFSYYFVLANHARIHTGERPYECTVCKRTFTQSGNLAKHSQIHTRETF